MERLSFSNRLTEIKERKSAARSERAELIGKFLEKLNADRKPPYKPLTAARVGMMLRFLKTPDLRAFLAECNYASHFGKYYWFKFKSAKESKNVIKSN